MDNNESHQLFKTDLCGFCYRVRGFLDEFDINVPLRDINTDQDAFRELLQGGGRATVPCLRIQRGEEVQWMFESMDIIRYLADKNGITTA
jgi:glutathione S-transferase